MMPFSLHAAPSPRQLALAVLALCLAASGCGRKDETHYEVTYGAGAGVERRRSVPREDARTRIALLPLRGQWEFREGRWLAEGFSLMLWVDLQQNIYLEGIDPARVEWTVRDLGLGEMRRLTPQEGRRVAEAVGADYFLTGTYTSDGTGIDLRVRLYDRRAGERVGKLGTFWPSFFGAVDSVSEWLRTVIPLDPRALEIPDRPITEILTGSREAAGLFCRGWWRRAREKEGEETVALLGEATTLDSTFALAGLTLYQAGRGTVSEDARDQVLERAFRHSGRLPESAALALEATYLHRRDRERGRGAIELLLDLYPSEALTQETAARLFLAWGEQERAIARFEEALGLNPWRGRLFEFLVGLYREAGHGDRALQLSRERVERFPRDPDARFLLAHLLTLRGELVPAEREFQKALVLEPAHARALEGLGLLRFRLHGDLKGAQENLRKALEVVGPTARARIYEELARAYFERGMLGRSLEILGEGRLDLASAKPDLAWRLDFEGARHLADVGNSEFALDVFRGSPLRTDPALSWIPELSSALVLAMVGRLDEARAVVEGIGAVVEEPGVEQAVLEMAVLGEIALAKGELEEALDRFHFVEALDPARRDNLLRIARTFVRMNRLAEADSVLTAALTRSPKGPRLHSELAYVLQAEGRLEDARGHLEEATRLWESADPGIPYIEDARRRLASVRKESRS